MGIEGWGWRGVFSPYEGEGNIIYNPTRIPRHRSHFPLTVAGENNRYSLLFSISGGCQGVPEAEFPWMQPEASFFTGTGVFGLGAVTTRLLAVSSPFAILSCLRRATSFPAMALAFDRARLSPNKASEDLLRPLLEWVESA